MKRLHLQPPLSFVCDAGRINGFSSFTVENSKNTTFRQCTVNEPACYTVIGKILPYCEVSGILYPDNGGKREQPRNRIPAAVKFFL